MRPYHENIIYHLCLIQFYDLHWNWFHKYISWRIKITEAIQENGISAIVSEDIADGDNEQTEEDDVTPEAELINEEEKLDDIETIVDQKKEDFEMDQNIAREPFLMAKIENVYHEPFQMTQEVKVCVW